MFRKLILVIVGLSVIETVASLTRTCETGCLDSVCYFTVGCFNCGTGYCKLIIPGQITYCWPKVLCTGSCTINTYGGTDFCSF